MSRKPETLGQAVKRAWRAPRGFRKPWLEQMLPPPRKPAHSKAGERQRAHDAKAVAKMQRKLAAHNRAVRRHFREARHA